LGRGSSSKGGGRKAVAVGALGPARGSAAAPQWGGGVAMVESRSAASGEKEEMGGDKREVEDGCTCGLT